MAKNTFVDNWTDLVSYIGWYGKNSSETHSDKKDSSCHCPTDKELDKKIVDAIAKHGANPQAILKEVYGKKYQNKSDVEKIVKTKIDAVVDSAPEEFDTLKEIAEWISTH